MKIMLISLALFTSLPAFAAEKIECTRTGETFVVVHMTREAKQINGHEAFSVSLNEELATPYAFVEDEIVTRDASAKADLLSSWNGNYGVKMSFGKGFLAAAAGAKSKAFVKAIYDDIEQDEVSTPVECVVVK